MTHTTARLGILISGRGSNMMALAEACADGRIPADVAVVISNRGDAPGLEWARSHGLATAVLSHREYSDRETHDRAVVARLRESSVDWVCLAGYMRLLSEAFIGAFPNRILNIHPSLLPAFPGLNAQRQALEYGVRVSGCTVHLVDTQLDNGPIVVQRGVPVEAGDTEEDLAGRILEQEHVAYPEAVRRLVGEDWRLDGRRVVFRT